MGVIYRAVEEPAGEQVAIKVVRIADENLLASFRREIFALRSLEHPCVVRVVADGIHDGQPWYAMPLLQGETFGELIDARHGRTPMPTVHGLIRSDSSLAQTSVGLSSPRREVIDSASFADAATEPPPDDQIVRADTLNAPRCLTEDRLTEVLGIMRALCSPLAYVHGRGLVHRDLKPDNVVIRRDGVPVLVDFGLAQLFDAGRSRAVLDVAGRVLGTPAYMAPEQIRGDLVDARADLYALGCLLFEALTGFTPFQGSAQDILRQHLYEAPPPPSVISVGISHELDELVLNLLEKDPSKRIGYASDVATKLAALGAPELPIGRVPRTTAYLYRPALAGRATQMRTLERALSFRNPESGACVVVGGPSGVGKTRLAMELATVAARRGMTVVTSQCQDLRDTEEGLSVRAAPLHPFRPLLLAIADRCRAEGEAITEQLVGHLGPILAPYEPSLKELPGQAQRPAPPELPAEAARVRLLDALAQLACRFAEQRPAFVLLDDLQWADELSLAFLGHLQARDFDRVPLVLLGTYRSDESGSELEELLMRSHVSGFEIGALDRGAVIEMVAGMLALREPPEALIDFLMEESAGNPFFIAEYLRAAIGERVLRRGASGQWSIGESAGTPESLRSALPMPGGMRDLMIRRIGQVSRAARALAEMAAVLGRELDGELLLDALVAVDGRASERTDGTSGDRAALDELRRAQILEEGERGRLRFVHDKMREHVYEALEPVRRSTMHHAAAGCIEARFSKGDDRALYYPALAHHYAMAGERGKTIEYLEKAGDYALASSAPGEARRFFERAFAIDDEQPSEVRVNPTRRARWARRLGESHYQLGHLGEARVHLTAALDLLAPKSGIASMVADPNLKGWLGSAAAIGAQLRRLAGSRPAVSERPETRSRLREAALAAERLSQVHYFSSEQGLAFGAGFTCVEHAEGLGPSPELARAYAVISVALGFVPMPPLVERYGSRACEIADQTGDLHAIAFTHFLRGLCAVNAGRHAEARRQIGRAIDVAEAAGDLRSQQEMNAVFGNALTMSGEFARAETVYRELEIEARRTRQLQGMQWGLSGRATALMHRGKIQLALELFEQSRAVDTGDRTQDLVHWQTALLHGMSGDIERAVEEARAVLELGESTAPTGYHCAFGYMAACEVFAMAAERASGLRRRADRRRFVAELDRSARVLERFARIFPVGRAQAALYRGLWHDAAGHPRRAKRQVRRALELATELDIPHERARSMLALGRLERPGGRAARRHLEAARDLYARIDAAWWRGQCDEALCR